MEYDVLTGNTAQPRNDWLKLALLFGVVVLLVCMRNLKPLTFPTLYAEDGKWLGWILRSGFWDAGLHGRDEFPVLGMVTLLYGALAIVKVFFNGDVSYLPIGVFIVSTAFISVTAVSAFKLAPSYLSLSSRLALLAAVLLMPVGHDGNEIFGRVLNLGFVFPVLQVVLLVHLLENKPRKLGVIFSLLYLLIAGMTFPVCIAFNMIGAAVFISRYLLSSRSRGGRFDIGLGLSLVAITGFAVLQLGTTVLSSKGGAPASFYLDGWVDFALARALLFPFVYFVYRHLNNPVVIAITAFVLAFLIYATCRVASRRPESRFVVALVGGCWACYYLATIIMRSGFTSLFGNYSSSFPDRYFYGLNVIFLFFIIYLANAAFKSMDDKRIRGAVPWVVILFLLVGTKTHFEMTHPRFDWGELGTFGYALCQQSQNQGSLPLNSAEGKLTVPIYPAGWRFEMPRQGLFSSSATDCEKILNDGRAQPVKQ